MALYTRDFMEALTPSVQTFFDIGAASIEDARAQIFDVQQDSVGIVNRLGLGAISTDVFDGLSTIGIPGRISADAGYSINWVPVEYPAYLTIPKPLVEHGNGIDQRYLRNTGVTWQAKVQKLAMDLFNNAFTDTGTEIDGVSLCNAAHPHGPSNSATYNNTSTGALNAARVEMARSAMVSQENDAGDPVGMPPNVILVPTALESTALQIANSALANRDNQINARQGQYTVVSSPYLTSPTAWFMINTLRGSLLWVETDSPGFDPQAINYQPHETNYGVYARAAFGVLDPRDVYGSTGTG